MFTWAERRKNEKSEFRAQISQADGSLTPGFVKQRIREPDTLFFYAQAGRLGLTARRRVASELPLRCNENEA